MWTYRMADYYFQLANPSTRKYIKVFEFDIVLFKKLPDHPFNVYVICNGVLLFIFLFWIIFLFSPFYFNLGRN